MTCLLSLINDFFPWYCFLWYRPAKANFFFLNIFKEYYRTKLVPSFPMFLRSDHCLSETSEQETAVAISFQGKDLNLLISIAKNTNSSSWTFLLLLNVLSKIVCHARSPVWTTWHVSLSKLLLFQTKLENLLVKSIHRTNKQLWELPSKARLSITLHCDKKFIFELCFKI